jgi:hypothetical protein
VADFLRIKESDLVRSKIQQTLTHLANLRLEKKFFENDKPAGPGDLVTCEGLETFLVPAVEGVLPFSEFIDSYDRKDEFCKAIREDLEGLISLWKDKIFPGKPYTNPEAIRRNIRNVLKGDFKKINIVESAALACRVLVHLITLGLNRTNESVFSKHFNDMVRMDVLGLPLKNAIQFLLDSFQKGTDAKNPIGSARAGNASGSGWSWTDNQGLPPMLFFTASAVDAFAELDLYLIRLGDSNQLENTVAKFFVDNRGMLEELQFCVDMSRRWVSTTVLYEISNGYGFFAETYSDGTEFGFDSAPEGYKLYENDLQKLDRFVKYSPFVLYNNLYALLILLWSYGDWDDDGSNINPETKAMIERAITQLVSNYRNLDVCNEILNQFEYTFWLTDKSSPKETNNQDKIFVDKKDERDLGYLDSGFKTLLTRLLVLYLAYGVGDRVILEPLVRDLYIDLLLDRYREGKEYAYLWSKRFKEIFSTQRAIQALTFYTNYARGRDELAVQSVPQSASEWASVFLSLSQVLKGESNGNFNQPVKIGPPLDKKPPMIPEQYFVDYWKRTQGEAWSNGQSVEQRSFLKIAQKLGDTIIDDHRKKRITFDDATKQLNSLIEILKDPIKPDSLDGELDFDKLNSLDSAYRQSAKNG